KSQRAARRRGAPDAAKPRRELERLRQEVATSRQKQVQKRLQQEEARRREEELARRREEERALLEMREAERAKYRRVVSEGLDLLDLGRFEDAANSFSRALRLYPNDRQLRLLLDDARRGERLRDEHRAALDFYRKREQSQQGTIKGGPSHEHTERVQTANRGLGLVFLEEGDRMERAGKDRLRLLFEHTDRA